MINDLRFWIFHYLLVFSFKVLPKGTYRDNFMKVIYDYNMEVGKILYPDEFK